MGNTVRIRLLGGLEAEFGGEVVRDFSVRKAASLLAYLAFHAGRSISREELAGLLWPDSEPDAALTSLRSALYRLGKLFPDGRLLQVSRTSIGLDMDVAEVDVREMQAAYVAANKADAEEQELALLALVADLYRGPLLNGFLDEWVLPERMRLEEMAGDALLRLALAHEQKGAFEEALRYLRRATAINPVDEVARCAVMRSYARSGNRAQALKEFEDLCVLLEDQLGLEPSPATTDLSERIVAGEFDPCGEAEPADALTEALNWYLKSNPAQAVATLVEMSEFWRVHRSSVDGLQMVHKVLAVAEPGHPFHGKLLHLAAFLSYQLSEYVEAERLYREAVGELRGGDDERELLRALTNYAFSLREGGDDLRARELIAEARVVSEGVEDVAALLQFKVNTAGMLCHFDELPAGIGMYLEAAGTAREHRKLRALASCLANLSFFVEDAAALGYEEEALQLARASGDQAAIGFARLGMGASLMRAGRLAGARVSLESALRLARARRYSRLEVLVSEVMAELLLLEGDSAGARALLAVASSAREGLGARRSAYEDGRYRALVGRLG